MRRLIPFILLAILLAACGPDRAQTIDPPVATRRPAPIKEPTATPVPPTATAEPSPTRTPTAEPSLTLVPTDEPTLTPMPTAAPTETPTEEPTPIPPTATTAPPTPVPTQAPIGDASQVDQAALMASLLTINDMPTGWAGGGAVFEPRTPGGTYTSFCAQLPARSIAAAYVEFEKSALGPYLTHSIVVYPDSASARAAFDDLVAAAQNCPQVTDSSGSVNTLSPLSFPSIGEATFAIRSSGAVEMDAINILVDNVLINIRHGAYGSPVDSALTETVARAAVERYGR